jgi:hypothetical protein
LVATQTTARTLMVRAFSSEGFNEWDVDEEALPAGK